MTIIRLVLLSIAVCGFLYVPAVLSFAKILVPEQASGSLVRNADGKIIGSRRIAQSFAEDRYFHPRPSACDYNAQGAAGSNLSPTNPELAARAKEIIATYPAGKVIPADLVTASGSGLDPHISRDAAIYQISRISTARHLAPEKINALIPAGGIVNVLELNLALDELQR
jgi:potassium-transporting ATPase KdpC subunit